MSWYYHKNLKPIGPFTEKQIQEKILGGEIGPHDLICFDMENDWKNASEWAQFKKASFTAWQKPGEQGQWVLLQWDKAVTSYKQNGPYTYDKLIEGLQDGSINAHDYIWKEGMSGWSKLKDRSEFKGAISQDL